MKKILILMALALALAPGHARAAQTLAQMIQDARTLSQDAASPTRQRFPDWQIINFLNHAQREMNLQTHCLRQSIQFNLVAGTTYYALPSNYLNVQRVTKGGLYIQEMSPAALDGRSRGWEATSGSPVYYFMNFSSRNLIGFTPFPGVAADTDTMKVEFDIQPTDLSALTDTAFNGVSEFQDYSFALAYYAASVMQSLQGLQTQSKAYMDVYTSMVMAMSKRCLDRPNYLPSAVGTP